MYAFDITDIIGYSLPRNCIEEGLWNVIKQQEDLLLMKSLKKKVIYQNYTVKHFIQYQ